jgi:DNA-binding GntR family transcriptional regulator
VPEVQGEALRGLANETLADQAYEALRGAIISGELGSGEKITERGLAERLSVSPTPVREALRRLEQDRLVVRHGPRLVQVVDFDDEVAAEVRLAEGALRAVAARLAAKHATPAQLAELERLLDAGDAELDRLRTTVADPAELTSKDLAPVLDITRRFHARLNAACGNPVIIRLLSLVDAFRLASLNGRLVEELGAEGNRAALERYHHHRLLFDAVAAGDGITAERLMRVHDQRDGLEPD